MLAMQSPLGVLALNFDDRQLTQLDFCAPTESTEKINHPAFEQLNEYFAGKRQHFDLPLAPNGTPFQLTVWQALQRMPFGETLTYGQLAEQLNTSARAVGNACRNNPIPIIIPCHRIVSSKGLGGYNGATTDAGLAPKKWLLDLEKAIR